MNDSSVFQSDLAGAGPGDLHRAAERRLLRMVRAAQPVTRSDIATRLGIDKTTVTENIKPLIASGLIREDKQDGSEKALSFAGEQDYFIGVNLGVRSSQVGLVTLRGEMSDEDSFETPPDPQQAIAEARKRVEALYKKNEGRALRVIGVSVPGMTDAARSTLIYAPNLGWRDLNIAGALTIGEGIPVVVENDATATAMYEARLKMRDSQNGVLTNFILVRSGTGIGVGLVIGGEVYRGTGSARGIAGEFGHMTIVAGGKSCVCGNRGCWEKYASAASAASLYMGDRPLRRGETLPRFVEIVTKAENGDIRSRKTLEKIGDYLGMGIANVIMGIGIPRVIISGRLVYGWQFIREPLYQAINRSIIGKIDGWTVEAGAPEGSALGGALEVAVEEYLSAM